MAGGFSVVVLTALNITKISAAGALGLQRPSGNSPGGKKGLSLCVLPRKRGCLRNWKGGAHRPGLEWVPAPRQACRGCSAGLRGHLRCQHWLQPRRCGFDGAVVGDLRPVRKCRCRRRLWYRWRDIPAALVRITATPESMTWEWDWVAGPSRLTSPNRWPMPAI